MRKRIAAVGVTAAMALGLVGCIPSLPQQGQQTAPAPESQEAPAETKGEEQTPDTPSGDIADAVDASQTTDASPVPLGQWGRVAIYSVEDDAYHDVNVRIKSVVTQSEDSDAIDAAIAENNELGYDFQQVDLADAELPDDVEACLLTYEVSIPDDFPAGEPGLPDPSISFDESNVGGGGIPAPDGTTYIGLGSNNTELLTKANNSDTVFEPGKTYEFCELFTMVKGYENYVFDVNSYPDGTEDTSADVMYTAYFAAH